jgi:hypothetical protein
MYHMYVCTLLRNRSVHQLLLIICLSAYLPICVAIKLKKRVKIQKTLSFFLKRPFCSFCLSGYLLPDKQHHSRRPFHCYGGGGDSQCISGQKSISCPNFAPVACYVGTSTSILARTPSYLPLSSHFSSTSPTPPPPKAHLVQFWRER